MSSAHRFDVVSVDDHLVEPRGLYDGRVPKKFEDLVPKVVDTKSGKEIWVYDGEITAHIGVNAVVGRPRSEWGFEPTRFDQMRPGCYEIHERIKDMDVVGVRASLNFPSGMSGFCGRQYAKTGDPELGLAVMRAYNSWHLEEWAGPYPERIIPLQVAWLADPKIAAEEVVANAARGFKAVSFAINPSADGWPSLYSGEWDPFLRACEDTGTVLCLHIGSSGIPYQEPDSPKDVGIVLTMPRDGITAATGWLLSGVPLRFPDLKILLAESGITWVPAFLERVDFVVDHHNPWTHTWMDNDRKPSEVFKSNFYVSSVFDPFGMAYRHDIGVETILVECDYPHADSTWPHMQEVLADELAAAPDDEVEAITHGNADKLFCLAP